MAIDMNRVLEATVQAILDGQGGSPVENGGKSKKRGLKMPGAFLVGAGAVMAGRLVVGSRGRDLLGSLQERLVEYEHRHFDGDDEDDPSEDLDEEPEAEEDEDFDEEPEAEQDEDFDEEPEADEDEEPEESAPRRRARSRSGSRR